MFYVGQKMVCVRPNNKLIKGEIYSSGGQSVTYPDQVYVEELGIADNGKPWCAKASRFAPLQTFGEEACESVEKEMNAPELMPV